MLYFDKTATGFRVKPEVQNLVSWKQLNLFDDFRHLGEFNIVFCRNVLIYYEVEDKANILKQMRYQMADDAFLILGAAETVIGLSDRFDRHPICRAAVYSPSAV